MQTLHTDLSSAGIQSMVPQWDKCLNFIGECRGLICTTATYVSCVHQSQNEVLSIRMSLHYFLKCLCIFNSISLAGMRIFVPCEGSVTHIASCKILQIPTNQPGPWFAQICNEGGSNQAKITFRYLLKLNLSTVITLTLVLNSSPDIQTKHYLATVQLLLFTSAASSDPCISTFRIISLHLLTDNRLQHTCTRINRRNESAYMMLETILNNPRPCNEQVDLLTKPTNVHKCIKVSVVI